MRKLISVIAVTALAATSACSTNGGMYSASNPQHNEFSGWKTAGAVLLGVLTLGAVGAGAYAGAKDSRTTYSQTGNVVFVSGDNYRRTYLVNGEYVTCYRNYSTWSCY